MICHSCRISHKGQPEGCPTGCTCQHRKVDDQGVPDEGMDREESVVLEMVDGADNVIAVREVKDVGYG